MAATKLYTITPEGSISVNMGAMRHSITIQQLGPASPPTYDASGGPLKTYQPLLPGRFAGIEVVRGTDLIKGGVITTQLFLTILVWYEAGILPAMRILNNGNNNQYIIQSIENILERNEVLVLNCLGLGQNT